MGGFGFPSVFTAKLSLTWGTATGLYGARGVHRCPQTTVLAHRMHQLKGCEEMRSTLYHSRALPKEPGVFISS